jgi:serine/threonine-protein kinase
MARASNNRDFGSNQQFGRFHLRELLNTGGMSEIWLVSDERGKPYALRILKRELRFNFTARRRFMRGCDILSQLTESDHIVGYVEHGKAEGTCYLLMDYVEAENLKELYARQDVLLKENVAQILIDAATGLSDVHESGYMHLDFKPENILVTRNAAVRLIDFDMAQPLPDKPVKFSKNPGTPGYMAPEQLKREPIDARVDIFAFGVSAYEMLTYQKPFPGDSPAEILAAHMQPSGPMPLREHNPDVPVALEKVVLKCLERDPDRRYPFSGVMLRELQSALYV